MGELHHYVPQFLLKNFRGGSRPQVHVLDKHTDKTFRAAVTKVAAIKGYYDAPSDLGLSLEPGLSTLETGAAASIEKIVSSKSLAVLSDEDKVVIALFAAAQIVRVPHWREMLKDFARMVREALAEHGGDPDSMDLAEPAGDELQAESLAWFRHVPELAPYFLNKDWILYRAPVEALYISDNPLVMHNATDLGPYGNLGLDVPRIQLYLPLSSRLVLGMMSQQIRRDTEAQIAQVHVTASTPARIVEARARLDTFAAQLRFGATVDLVPANVDHLNSLQVRTSTRYLYSASGNFDLAREILRDWPTLIHGARWNG